MKPLALARAKAFYVAVRCECDNVKFVLSHGVEFLEWLRKVFYSRYPLTHPILRRRYDDVDERNVFFERDENKTKVRMLSCTYGFWLAEDMCDRLVPSHSAWSCEQTMRSPREQCRKFVSTHKQLLSIAIETCRYLSSNSTYLKWE